MRASAGVELHRAREAERAARGVLERALLGMIETSIGAAVIGASVGLAYVSTAQTPVSAAKRSAVVVGLGLVAAMLRPGSTSSATTENGEE